MYADFGTVSFSAMSSNSEPSTPGKSSGAVQSGSPPRPTSGSLHASESEAREGDDGGGGGSGVETGEHGGGENRAPGGGDDGLQEEVAESSGAGWEEPSTEAEDGADLDRGGDGTEDGYHTPTSPRCRIPANLPCPPAPRKIPPKWRWRKRNLGDQEIYRVVRRRIQLSGEFELVLRRVIGGHTSGRVKNVAGEEDVVG